MASPWISACQGPAPRYPGLFYRASNPSMSKAKKSSRGKLFSEAGKNRYEPEVLDARAIEPSKSVEDWLEWLRIVRRLPESYI